VKKPDDIAAARTLLDSRPEYGQGEHTVDFRVVVTPAKGVFTRAADVTEGGPVSRGAALGTIRTNRDEHTIVSPQPGLLTEWLRDTGDIVAAGLPVARIEVGTDGA
jgi:[acyl-carrier-protein] S-malonyltransferase